MKRFKRESAITIVCLIQRGMSDVIDDRVPYTKRCERSGRVPYTKRCERSINAVCLIQRGVSNGEHHLPDGELLR